MPLARVFPLEICNVGYNQCGEFTMHLFIHIPGAYDKQSKKKEKKKDQCSTLLLSAPALKTWRGCAAVRRELHFITKGGLQRVRLMARQYVKVSLCSRELPGKALKPKTRGVTGVIFSTADEKKIVKKRELGS